MFQHVRRACAIVCGLAAVSTVCAADDASPAAPTAAAAKIEYAKVKSKVLPGDTIGSAEGGWFCVGHHEIKAGEQIENAVNSEVERSFKKVARDQGLTLAANNLSAFDTGGPSDADYRLGGVLTALDSNICTYPNNAKGSVKVEIHWDLFSTKEQRVVLSRTTTGFHGEDSFKSTTVRDIDDLAFADAITKFVTDPEVKSLLSGGAPASAAAAPAPLHLAATAFIDGSTLASTETIRKSVATISSDAGSGSGFYIADGYLLSNRHVVGGAKYVKVKLSTGRELVGEVVREDGPRDVALVKTENAGLPALRLRDSAAVVGEEVWAVGSPLGERLAGTFTRGVLSGVRAIEGRNFLQSDVAVNPGNSGGPLIDARSGAIGLTTVKVANTSGLAFFVPGPEALARLGVVIDAAPVAQPH